MAQISIEQGFQLAVQHHQAGRLRDAELIYRAILAQQPGHAEALHFLGVIAHQTGRNDKAVDLIRQAIAISPDYADAYNNLALVLKARGELDEAIACCRHAIALRTDYAEAYNNLGIALMDKGQLDEAIADCRQAIALSPGYAEAHHNLGNCLGKAGRDDEAIAAYRQAISLNPNLPETHSCLGSSLRASGDLDEAITAYRQAVVLQSNSAEAHYNLGIALMDKGQLDEAIAANRNAIALKADYAEAHNNLGIVLFGRGKLDEAGSSFRQAIAVMPDYAEAHYNLALVLLTGGDLPGGFKEHEWRWKIKHPPTPPRNFIQAQWDGSPLCGRTILLHAEQGFGDTLQFIRYLPMVVQMGGQVIVECPAELKRLVQSMGGACRVVDSGSESPRFDVQCPFLSLPQVLGTTLEGIPGKLPYIEAEVGDVEKWRHRLAGDPALIKVGLAWAGNPKHRNDRNRSIAPVRFAPLSQVPCLRFFNLQKDWSAQAPPPGIQWVDLMDEMKDFADCAGLIANLDLVISVDTAMAHLSGAMGKSVWTLLPFMPDWRWMLHRQDSPWYPTMRLFRQPAIGDWESPMREVTEALIHLVGA